MNYIDLGYDGFLSKSIFNTRQSSADNRARMMTGSIVSSVLANDSVTDAKISSVSADKITAGTIQVSTFLGGENILLDGEETRILIFDGMKDRILLGKE